MHQVVIVYLLRWEFGLEIIYFRKKKVLCEIMHTKYLKSQ